MRTTDFLVEIGEKNQIIFSYINEIKMVDNFLPVFKMEKEIVKENKKGIEEKVSIKRKDLLKRMLLFLKAYEKG